MSINFSKMHGLGNDFMVIDGINQDIDLTSKQIAKLAQRNTGVGFDQLLLIESSTQDNIDFNYRIFNADGQEVGQCGNGARCLAIFAKHHGLTTKNHLKVATKTTQMSLHINADHTVSVDMGVPQLNPLAIPLKAQQQACEYQLSLDDGTIVSLHALSVGNPHAVLIVPEVATTPVTTLGHQISFHPCFPEQTNVGFMHIINPHHIKLRVYERGCGETLACGSGAVAAVAVGRLYHHLDKEVRVSVPGGDLLINWPDFTQNIILRGPAILVYEGQVASSFL
ncbi:MAG: diaminopimelate epimerase [Legionella sp.]|uniref:diaminopimelate epimerase n=1 Tax=Legionella sp. TaxID=459 RepID=UPI0039E70734